MPKTESRHSTPTRPVPSKRGVTNSACLMAQSPTAQGDPVARFRPANGARRERLDRAGTLPKTGLRQSPVLMRALMVSDRHDLDEVESRHEAFTQGKVVLSP